MQGPPIGLRLISTDQEYYPCRRPGTYWGICNMPLPGYYQLLPIKNTSHADGRVYAGAYAIRPYRAMNNFYWKRILPMRTVRYMRGRMQYAPTGLGIISTDKEYYPCGQRGIYRDVCNRPLLGCDQFLLIKNTTHADDRTYVGAYAIRPCWVTTNFYRERILLMRMARYMRRRMQYAPTWLQSISTDKEYYSCRWLGVCGGICNTILLGCDQFLLIKNTTHADDRVYAGAYAIRPYRFMINFCR